MTLVCKAFWTLCYKKAQAAAPANPNPNHLEGWSPEISLQLGWAFQKKAVCPTHHEMNEFACRFSLLFVCTKDGIVLLKRWVGFEHTCLQLRVSTLVRKEHWSAKTQPKSLAPESLIPTGAPKIASRHPHWHTETSTCFLDFFGRF